MTNDYHVSLQGSITKSFGLLEISYVNVLRANVTLGRDEVLAINSRRQRIDKQIYSATLGKLVGEAARRGECVSAAENKRSRSPK